jgi:peptide/nickel transport system substrate-binding protein
MKKALVLSAVGIAATGMALAAPFKYPATWTVTPAGQAQTGGTYRWAVLTDHKTLNPFQAAESGNIPGQIAISLFQVDPTTLQYIPWMAETHTVSADNKTITVNLRSGMKWSDGKPVVPEDVITSFKIHADEEVGSNEYTSFYVNDKPITVTKVDNDTLRFVFPAPSAEALAKLSFTVWPNHVFGPVYASKGAAGIKAMWTLSEPAANIVSGGAFKFAGYRPGERASFVKNPYFGEWNVDASNKPLPYLDGYTQTVTKDLNAWFAQYLAGQLDTFGPRNADDLAQIKRAIDGGQLKAVLRPNVSPQASSTWIVWNWNKSSDPTKQALFRNVKFRQAMSHLANRQAMIDIVLGGLGQPAYSSVYAVFGDWISPNLKKYDYNLEAARKLLGEIGYTKKNSAGWLVNQKNQVLEFDLTTNAGNNTREGLAKIFADEAKKIGVKVNFKPIDFNTLVSQLTSTGANRPFDAILLGLSGGTAIYPLGSNVEPCTGNLHAFNQSGKCLEPWETQVTALYTRGEQTLDTAARKAIAHQIQNIQSQYQGFVYLVSPTAHFTYTTRVQGEYPAKIATAYTTSRDLVLTWIKE